MISPFPIRAIDFSNKSDKSMHDKMVKLVESMLDLHKKPARSTTGQCSRGR